MIRLLLLGTSGCHLCEQAEQIINDYLPNNVELTIETVDIAEQEQWQEQYAHSHPRFISSGNQKRSGMAI